MTALWIVLALVAVLGIATVVSYNRFVQQRNVVQESWRQIDVELTRRHDLIPNLVETVKGYAAHEREIFEEVARARSAAMTPGAGPAQQAAQEGVLGAALGRLFAVAEAYPQLQANQNFLALQQQLTETEDRIAAGRRFYNANVRALNVRVESFPSSIVASIFHFEKAEYFEAEDPAVRAVPTVDFGTGSGVGGPGAGVAVPPSPAPGSAPGSAPGAGAGTPPAPGAGPTPSG
jgi:LemA protein